MSGNMVMSETINNQSEEAIISAISENNKHLVFMAYNGINRRIPGEIRLCIPD